MSKLTFEYDESGESKISAFAFNTGHLIEELINEQNDYLINRIKETEVKILGFYQSLNDIQKKEYAEYFGIKSFNEGKL